MCLSDPASRIHEVTLDADQGLEQEGIVINGGPMAPRLDLGFIGLRVCSAFRV